MVPCDGGAIVIKPHRKKPTRRPWREVAINESWLPRRTKARSNIDFDREAHAHDPHRGFVSQRTVDAGYCLDNWSVP
jgi:hypothetical protein